jgi:Protein of unknown function (DUF2971)
MQEIRSLYHYQPFHVDRIARIFATGTIYCSNPKDFNDPWDSRACFSKTLLDDPAAYGRTVQWFLRTGLKHGPLISPAEYARREQELRTNRNLLEWMIDEMTRRIGEAVNSQYRVYCLSTHGDIPLMWSHYASAHRGVCLEFSVHSDLFCGALAIEYLEHYPQFDLAQDDKEAALATLLAKSEHWSYENEYRLIVAAPGYTFPGLPTTNDNFLPFPAGSLRAVIMGCLMQKSDRDDLVALIKNGGSRVELMDARLTPDRYELELRTVR